MMGEASRAQRGVERGIYGMLEQPMENERVSNQSGVE